MSEEKGLGSKLLGLFVERDGSTPDTDDVPARKKGDDEKSPADLVAELAGQSAPKRAAPAAEAPVSRPAVSVPSPSGPVTPAQVDFDGVFKQAGIDAAELDRVRKAEELLKGLPEATPVDVKRQIVEASLKAFGFEVLKIVAAANTQLKALDTFSRLKEQQTAKAITDAQAKIAQLEEQVMGLRADITKRTEELASMAAAAENRKEQVNQVLAFFAAP